MTRHITKALSRGLMAVLLVLLGGGGLHAQTTQCTVRDNRMYIELRKDISDRELDAFIDRYDLSDLYLKAFLRRNMSDSLERQGWKVERNNAQKAVLYRPLFAPSDLQDPAERFRLTSTPDPKPTGNFGVNRFLHKFPFLVRDSLVTFFLRDRQNARNVQLAGSFTDWQRRALRMTKTDSGWIAVVVLPAGKYWYKFIVDGNWDVDRDNYQTEDDGNGNVNSVYYKTNYVFQLAGFPEAKNVVLAGSFNNWNKDLMHLGRTASGWALAAFVGEGSFLYKFIVDGRWMADPANPNRIDDGARGFNSVLRKGRPATFVLAGFPNARKVSVAGTFNNWRRDEIFLNKTESGWALPFVLGPGQYEYKFIVDGNWIADPANPLNTEGEYRKGNSVLVVGANHTFRLPAKAGQRNAYVAGDFNGWNSRSLPMQRQGSDWVISLYLPAGKHRYKFITDGAWILDPGNKLWEQNEFNNGNSVLWIE